MTDVRLTMPNFPAFMVARKGRTARPGSTLPRMRYLTLDEAATQAKAEAAADPGKVIIVFQEVLRAKAEPSSTIPAAAPSPRRPGEPGDHPPRSPGSKGGA